MDGHEVIFEVSHLDHRQSGRVPLLRNEDKWMDCTARPSTDSLEAKGQTKRSKEKRQATQISLGLGFKPSSVS
jgi:hypothetical protein